MQNLCMLSFLSFDFEIVVFIFMFFHFYFNNTFIQNDNLLGVDPHDVILWGAANKFIIAIKS